MFVCGFCDDGDTNRHFEEMTAARDHIRSEHKIKKDAMIDKAIKASSELLQHRLTILWPDMVFYWVHKF